MRTFLLCFAFLVGAACGDSVDQNADADAVEVIVLVPSGGPVLTDGRFPQLTWSLEYKVVCPASVGGSLSSDDAFTVEGTLEQTSGFELELDGPVAAWKGTIEFEPGPCAVQLLARDADGEVVCSYLETMTFDSPLPPEMYLNMICYATCPTIPLPDPETVLKTVCAPVGGLILSAEIPADVRGVQSIRYVIRDTETSFLDNELDLSNVDDGDGELELADPGTVDLGEGPARTHTWEAIVGVIVASDSPYTVLLTAFDAEGTALCSAGTTIKVISDGIAQVHVVLPCKDESP